jgi:hypothetical protein
MKRKTYPGKTNCIHLLEAFCSKKVTLLLMATLLSVLAGIRVSAQNINEYNSMIAQMKTSGTASIKEEASHIESLAFSLQPKVYIENGIESYSGNTDPVCANIDVASISSLYVSNSAFNKVELISIRIKSQSELNFVLNYSSLKDFQSLKYVEFLCDFNCNPTFLKSVLSNFPESGILFFYQLSVDQ